MDILARKSANCGVFRFCCWINTFSILTCTPTWTVNTRDAQLRTFELWAKAELSYSGLSYTSNKARKVLSKKLQFEFKLLFKNKLTFFYGRQHSKSALQWIKTWFSKFLSVQWRPLLLKIKPEMLNNRSTLVSGTQTRTTFSLYDSKA